MVYRVLVGITLAIVTTFTALGYYGGRAAEAVLTFTGVADVPLSNVREVETLNKPGRFASEARAQIDSQLAHLMGIFQSDTFLKVAKSKGTIGETYDIRFTSIEDGSSEGRKRLTYEFKGKTVFDKRIFGSDRKVTVPIKLPLAPDLIYQQTLERNFNPCTDEHYNTEGDFWYFWDPDQRGCSLKGDEQKVFRTRGRMERLDKLVRPTYPEYDRLFGDNGNGNVFDVRIFFGYIDDDKPNKKPNRRDDAFIAMTKVHEVLQKNGFSTTREIIGFRETPTGQQRDGANILREYTRQMRFPKLDPEPVDIHIQMLLSDTSIGADQRASKPDFTFHHYLIPAFREADMILYDGHSGLGANLDLKSLDRFRFRKDKYQIFVFNGCSTYPYYNGSFFDAKGGRGANNLEVITSGLPTLSSTSGPNTLAFLNRFLDGKLVTYQTIMRGVEKSNKRAGTYLMAVNGDEDNRFRPSR